MKDKEEEEYEQDDDGEIEYNYANRAVISCRTFQILGSAPGFGGRRRCNREKRKNIDQRSRRRRSPHDGG